MDFLEQKEQDLKRIDKSRKGGIDSRIRPLIDLLNRHESMYTTSSCAGRIILIAKASKRKDLAKWIYTTHGLGELPKILQAAHEVFVGEYWYKQEGMILHIRVADLQTGYLILDCAQRAGFKHSGITGKRKLVLEITSSDKIEALIGVDGTLIVDDHYFETITAIANKKQEGNWKKIDAFERNVKETFFSSGAVASSGQKE
ncbi:MAG: tRNA wybutosine-synthesizing 3 family protein [archaeon]